MVDNRCKILLLALLLLFLWQEGGAQTVTRGDSLFVFPNRGMWNGRRGGDVKKQRDTKGVKPAAARKKKSVTKKKSSSDKAVTKVVKKSVRRTDSVTYERKYSLGDRVIMRGDSGADVKKVAEILVAELFIDEKNIPYTPGGKVLYDGELIRAVRIFQKVEGLYDDGMVGEPTVKSLRKRQSRKR